MTYQTTIVIWSNIGHTPITGRGGSYCDELLRTTVECESPSEARALVKNLLNETQYSYMGYFNMPEYWNQNTRNAYVTA
jgi:hypothetical protein